MRALIAIGGSVKHHDWIRSEITGAGFDLLIAADSGAVHLLDLGLRPDYLIGDLDSISDELKMGIEKNAVEIVRLPVDKDWTDTEYSIRFAIEKGADDIVLLGSFSLARPDHLLANILRLAGLKKELPACRIRLTDGLTLAEAMVGPQVETFSLATLPRVPYIVSLFPISETVDGVTYEGLAYPLTLAELTRGASRSISNFPIRDDLSFTVSIEAGTAVAVFTPEE